MAANSELELAKLRRQLAVLDQAMGSGVLTVEGADGTGRVSIGTTASRRLTSSSRSLRSGESRTSRSGLTARAA